MTETIRLNPPEVLTQPCIKPATTELKTNADLVRMISLYIEALDICAAKHDALVLAIKEE